MRPLAIDLFCGLGGWTDGLLAEGYDVVGFDIERHEYGDHRYPAQLVLQDVLTLRGSQFRGAALIVASPPCQEFSYMAMPWSKAKAKIRDIESNPTEWLRLCALFDACFRIQAEACAAAGHHIPLVVENVRGAQRWVGRSRWNFGSFHLWGDVPALMPMAKAIKVPGFRFDGSSVSFQAASVKTVGHPHRRDGHAHTRHLTSPCEHQRIEDLGVKAQSPGHYLKPGSGADWFDGGPAAHWSGSVGRKVASAMIAKIPLPLSRHIARTFYPTVARAA